jgi:hypothetical protein
MSRGPHTIRLRETTRLVRAVVAAGLTVRAVQAEAGKITVLTSEVAAGAELMTLNGDLDRELLEFEKRTGKD